MIALPAASAAHFAHLETEVLIFLGDANYIETIVCCIVRTQPGSVTVVHLDNGRPRIALLGFRVDFPLLRVLIQPDNSL